MTGDRRWVAPALVLCLLLALTILTSCSSIQPPEATATPAPAEPVAEPVAESDAARQATPIAQAQAPEGAADNETIAPVSLAIPALNIEIPVTRMGWELALVNGERTTRWVVPQETAGWAINSAGAGESGNTVIIGHQVAGSAILAPLALGEIEISQEIVLTGSNGEAYVYKVTAVSDPIRHIGATPADQEEALAYLAPSATGRLTLITGWPAEVSTHRIFAVAELIGPRSQAQKAIVQS